MFATAPHESLRHVDSVEGFTVPVILAGPDEGRVVVMFDQSPSKTAFGDVRRRLHVAMLRTVTIPVDDRLTAKSVIGLLDKLQVSAALLVGDRTGGDLAWDVAATQQGRFIGLVVVDSGHPCVPDADRLIRDRDCRPVHTATTALVSSRAAHAIARESRRLVHGDFRITDLAGRRGSPYYAAQLSSEIVLRTHSW